MHCHTHISKITYLSYFHLEMDARWAQNFNCNKECEKNLQKNYVTTVWLTTVPCHSTAVHAGNVLNVCSDKNLWDAMPQKQLTREDYPHSYLRSLEVFITSSPALYHSISTKQNTEHNSCLTTKWPRRLITYNIYEPLQTILAAMSQLGYVLKVENDLKAFQKKANTYNDENEIL